MTHEQIQSYLASTEMQIRLHLEEGTRGVPTTLTAEQFKELREGRVNAIIKLREVKNAFEAR